MLSNVIWSFDYVVSECSWKLLILYYKDKRFWQKHNHSRLGIAWYRENLFLRWQNNSIALFCHSHVIPVCLVEQKPVIFQSISSHVSLQISGQQESTWVFPPKERLKHVYGAISLKSWDMPFFPHPRIFHSCRSLREKVLFDKTLINSEVCDICWVFAITSFQAL